eukprot:3086309-Karenia_brevis.AAC.1
MDLDEPPPPPQVQFTPPAQALQANTEQLKAMQEHYQILINIGGIDSPCAQDYKKLIEKHSSKITPVAILKDQKSIFETRISFQKARDATVQDHQMRMTAHKTQLDTLKKL